MSGGGEGCSGTRGLTLDGRNVWVGVQILMQDYGTSLYMQHLFYRGSHWLTNRHTDSLGS